MAPQLHMVQEVAACVLTVGVLEAWVEVLKGWRRGVGKGRVRGGNGVVRGCRLTAAWVRCEVQKRVYLDKPSAICTILVRVLSLSVFSQFSFFLPFSRAVLYKPNIRFSVYIRPVWINALFVPEPFLPTLI